MIDSIGRESSVALAEGLQNALWTLGRVPRAHRSDNLSTAFRNLALDAREDFDTALRWADGPLWHDANAQQCGHRTRKRLDRECARSSQARRLEDALLLRGTRDFASLDAYRAFVDEIVGRRNANLAKRILLEKEALASLPKGRPSDFPVASSGPFILRRVLYIVS